MGSLFMNISLINHNRAEHFKRCLSLLCQQWACRTCGVCQQKESVGSQQVSDRQRGSNRQSVSYNMTAMFKTQIKTLIFQILKCHIICDLWLVVRFIFCCAGWSLLAPDIWLDSYIPHKLHGGGFYCWLMARSSSYIITNKDDSQDVINYL